MMLEQFFFACISTIGFSILFNIPRKEILRAAIGGGIGWIVYKIFSGMTYSVVTASFLGACFVATLGEFFARRCKQAVTVYAIPGILPLVPGAGMYYTMLAIIEKDFARAALIGSETIFTAGGIAAAILVISSIARLIYRKKI